MHRQSSSSFNPSRRQVVATVLATAIGAGFSHADESISTKSPRPANTLGFNTYGFLTTKTEDAIRIIAKIGYDTVQFDASAGRDADPVTVSKDRRADFRKVLQDTGLTLTAFQGIGRPSTSDKQHKADLDRIKLMMQYAHELRPDHPPVIETNLGGRDPWTTAKPLFVRRLADWVKLTEENATTIVIKPHRGNSMDRPEQAVELLKELGSPPRLRMSYDYSHFALRDMLMEDTIRIALPWTDFVAIKDVAVDETGAHFKLPGETGKIDYVALLRQFYQGGYTGDFNCEVSVQIFKQPGYDMVAAAKTSYANIAPAFIAAGVPRPKRA